MAWYLWALIFGGLGLALAYQRGKRINLASVREVSAALEEVFQPDDKLYTWIGGLVGFHAKYHFDSGPIERIEVTVTMLPRHSPLFMPISWLLFRSDRLFLTAFLGESFDGEWHVIEKGRLKALQRDLAGRRLERRNLHDSHLLLSTNEAEEGTGGAQEAMVGTSLVGASLERLISERGVDWTRLVHLAIVPDRHTVYLFVRGLSDAGRPAKLLLDSAALLRRDQRAE